MSHEGSDSSVPVTHLQSSGPVPDRPFSHVRLFRLFTPEQPLSRTNRLRDGNFLFTSRNLYIVNGKH